MERHEILEMMAELKLLGMRLAFDEVLANGVKRRHPAQRHGHRQKPPRRCYRPQLHPRRRPMPVLHRGGPGQPAGSGKQGGAGGKDRRRADPA